MHIKIALICVRRISWMGCRWIINCCMQGNALNDAMCGKMFQQTKFKGYFRWKKRQMQMFTSVFFVRFGFLSRGLFFFNDMQCKSISEMMEFFCLFGEESLFRAIDLHSEQIENLHLIPASGRDRWCYREKNLKNCNSPNCHLAAFGCWSHCIARCYIMSIVCQNMECKFKIPID